MEYSLAISDKMCFHTWPTLSFLEGARTLAFHARRALYSIEQCTEKNSTIYAFCIILKFTLLRRPLQQVRFGEASGETCGALGEPELVTANATRSAPTLPAVVFERNDHDPTTRGTHHPCGNTAPTVVSAQ